MNGKGDRNRTRDVRAFNRNFDAIKWGPRAKGTVLSVKPGVTGPMVFTPRAIAAKNEAFKQGVLRHIGR